MKPVILFILTFFITLCSWAQGYKIIGTVQDINDSTKLVGASVLLINNQDSTKRTGIVTDINGGFEFKDIANGTYRLRISFLGYVNTQQRVTVRNADAKTGTISLLPDAKMLKDVVVTGKMERVTQRNDTLVYNAKAFKTNPDANVEDLVAKMPNITIEDGKVKAQGEEVKKVTVDGRDFFGEDATLALRNLPAEVVDKIEVFDRASDQSKFTGFDDGNNQKTINIVTRTDRNNGQFGRLYAGAGTDGRYAAGLNTNYFKKATRVSLLAQANNINQQNFDMQDILGALGGGSNGTMGGGGNRGSTPQGGGNRSGGTMMGGGGFGGGSADNFMIGQQSGINTTNAIGLNYTDTWGRNVKVSGSYFYNQSQNQNASTTQRTYFSAKNQGQIYNSNYNSSNNNSNHRLNFRIEYVINKNNTLIISPRVSTQDNNTRSSLGAVTKTTKPLNSTENNNRSHSDGINFSNNLLWQHKFAKNGRTLSTGITTSINTRQAESFVKSNTRYFLARDTTTTTNDQRSETETLGQTLSANLNYTEPLGAKNTTQLQLSYSPSYTINNSDKETMKYNAQTKEYTIPDNRLSNVFDNTYVTQRAGAGLRFRIKQSGNLMLDLNYQNAHLIGNQTFPTSFTVNRTFDNFLPSLMFFSRNRTTGSSWRVQYRTSTNAPTINQLQNVVNNNNPLILTTGNPSLVQEYAHSGSLRYGVTNPKTAQSFFVNLMGTYTLNNITTATIFATRDTTVQGFLLKPGSQFSRPVNIEDPNWNVRSFITFGMPVTRLKANLNFNGGVGFSRVFGLINSARNVTDNTTLNGGLVLSSSQSERFDYTVSYSANYNIAKNTLQPSLSGNYFFQNTSGKFNWLTKKGFFLNMNVNHTIYAGLGTDFNQNFTLINGSMGQKFWKRQSGELKLTVFDVLGQNNSISRNITETYIEDATTRVLQRYFLLTFSYTLRNFR